MRILAAVVVVASVHRASSSGPRVIGALVGDVAHEPGARTKYGHFFDALERRCTVIATHDATLRGLRRVANAVRVVHPDRRRWRERFYKNLPAFEQRSRQVSRVVQGMADRADVVVQLGALFQTRVDLPTIVYTDYTAQLSARRPDAGRSPFTAEQRARWIGLERATLADAAHVFTRGAFVRDAIVSDYGLAPDRVTAVGGGVNLRQLPTPAPAAVGPPTALFIGKQLHRKGGDLLLEAFARARQEVPDAQLLLLTGDPVPAGMPLDGVEVIAPTWDRDAIVELYRRAHVFVLPSRLETWGDVLLEAMAFRLPCIGVEGEAMSEIVDHERNGLIGRAGDIGDLTEGLVRLLGDPDLRQRWGAAARRKVEEQYTWDHVVSRMMPVIRVVAAP